jgi:hypothetical protein
VTAAPPDTMRALCVRQPWAALIAEGLKTIELRSWFTHYRGPIAIVAARDLDRRGAEVHGRQKEPRKHLVAIANLADVRRALPTDAKFAMVGEVREGLYAWVLDEVKTLVPPVPCTGAQGLFSISTTLVAGYR